MTQIAQRLGNQEQKVLRDGMLRALSQGYVMSVINAISMYPQAGSFLVGNDLQESILQSLLSKRHPESWKAMQAATQKAHLHENKQGLNALGVAIVNDDLASVKTALEKGIRYWPEPKATSYLTLASENSLPNSLDIMRALLKTGLDPNTTLYPTGQNGKILLNASWLGVLKEHGWTKPAMHPLRKTLWAGYLADACTPDTRRWLIRATPTEEWPQLAVYCAGENHRSAVANLFANYQPQSANDVILWAGDHLHASEPDHQNTLLLHHALNLAASALWNQSHVRKNLNVEEFFIEYAHAILEPLARLTGDNAVQKHNKSLRDIAQKTDEHADHYFYLQKKPNPYILTRATEAGFKKALMDKFTAIVQENAPEKAHSTPKAKRRI